MEEEISTMVDDTIFNLFENAHSLMLTDSGNVTPEHSDRLEKIKEDLRNILFEQITHTT